MLSSIQEKNFRGNTRDHTKHLCYNGLGRQCLFRRSGMTGQMTVETAISNLYHNLLDAWNNRDAHAYALLFAEDANVTGYDGSQMNGRSEIETELSRIFAD